jgi:hypothetical protein
MTMTEQQEVRFTEQEYILLFNTGIKLSRTMGITFKNNRVFNTAVATIFKYVLCKLYGI